MKLKNILSGALATAMVASAASMSVFATADVAGTIFDSDLNPVTGAPYTNTTAASIHGDGVLPNTTFYFSLGDMATGTAFTGGSANVGSFTARDAANTDQEISIKNLTDDSYFKMKLDKDENSKMVKSITLVTDKRMNGGLDRGAYLKVVLNDSMTTSEIKTDGTVTFTAKANNPSSVTTDKWYSGDKIVIPYAIWINNKEVNGSDNSVDTGDRVYFNPSKNDTNTFIWGDDRAALKFDADDDASSFYARLSTSPIGDIYAQYGDPQNADLYFYNFVGNNAIPATSRATLTLGIPWDEDDAYTPNPADVFIYEVSKDGTLSDVTDQFTYSEDGEEIEGWSIKTRVLGTYVLSDTELDLEDDDVTVDDSSSEASSSKPIPNTGSSDVVSVAVVAAVLSLAAAGAVAFKKASK